MSSEMSNEQMQNKIAAARRDAEGLKDRIKRKKDELADASCKHPSACLLDTAQFFYAILSEPRLTQCQYEEWPRVIPMLYRASA